MNFNYTEHLPRHFSDTSRVWIYQSSRPFTMEESEQIRNIIAQFVATWKSHGTPVKGFGEVFFNQFIVLAADEAATGVSGCSTDSSVRLIQHIEHTFGVAMFNRQLLAFHTGQQVLLIPLAQLNAALENNSIQPESLYFNNLVSTLQELRENWLVPLQSSWLARRIKSRSVHTGL